MFATIGQWEQPVIATSVRLRICEPQTPSWWEPPGPEGIKCCVSYVFVDGGVIKYKQY